VPEQVLFWTLGPIMVLASLTLLVARRAVHVAAGVIVVMVGLAVFYIQLEAPFLGLVQIVVYTGAVMMLFLFVLMLVGVDQRESLKETILAQRWIAFVGAGGFAALVATAVLRVTIPHGNLSATNSAGNPNAIADELFGNFVLVMEILGLLLVTAAVGALLLTQVPRLSEHRTQRVRSEERVKGRLNPVNKPMPGVYARHNALDIPALGPNGEAVEASVSRVLKARHQAKDGTQWRAGIDGPSGGDA
jgi:NADH-quinone oxidoreductase subunit J